MAVCPGSNYVGDKSSKRQFSSRATCREILSEGNYLWGNCLGATVGGQSSRKQFSSGAIIQWLIIWRAIFLRGNYLRREFFRGNNPGAIVQGAIVWGAIIQEVIFLRTIVQDYYSLILTVWCMKLKLKMFIRF